MRRKLTEEKNSNASSQTRLMRSKRKKKSANEILKSTKNNKSYSAKTSARTGKNNA